MSAPDKATPRPWQADPDGEIIGPDPFDGESVAMVLLNERGPANARLIVRAVNNFDPLRALLTELLGYAVDAPSDLLRRAAKALAEIDADGGDHG